MKPMTGFQKKYLRGLAHKLKPVVFIGQKGITPALNRSITEALDRHELIKIKFIDFKEKQQKTALSEVVEAETDSTMVGMIGHMAIFYRQQSDPEKRKINLPEAP